MKQGCTPGKVTESLGGGRFRVQLADESEIIAYLAGKLRLRRIVVCLGDMVEVVLDPAGGVATNRIVWRR